MLGNRFGQLPADYRTRLHELDQDTLLKLSERVLTAKTIDDIFKDV
jgi:hypothetical protein